MDELQETVETLIELDEPETILPTLRKAAERKKGKRWQALAKVLGDAEFQLDLILNPRVAGPDFRPEEDLEEIEKQAGGPLDPDDSDATEPPPDATGPQKVDPPVKAA